MKIFKLIMIVFGVVAVIAVFLGGYFGLVPGLSKVFGSNKPRDIGVELSAQAAIVGAGAIGMPLTLADLEKIKADPKSAQAMSGFLSSEQASSLMLVSQGNIQNFPFRLMQIKFHADNSVEASGFLRTGNVVPFLQATGASSSVASAVGMALKPLPGDTPFYIKGRCAITENNVDLDVSSIEVGRLAIPSGYQGKESEAERYISNALALNGVHIKSLNVENGAVKIEGTRSLDSLKPWLHIAR